MGKEIRKREALRASEQGEALRKPVGKKPSDWRGSLYNCKLRPNHIIPGIISFLLFLAVRVCGLRPATILCTDCQYMQTTTKRLSSLVSYWFSKAIPDKQYHQFEVTNYFGEIQKSVSCSYAFVSRRCLIFPKTKSKEFQN